jgi:DNA-directed RNA polymerase subunit RPC12/RpoP
MVFPFELYCRKCGSMILSLESGGPLTDMMKIVEQGVSIDSWISNRLRGRSVRCPNCGRAVSTDPLVRGEVMFGEWGDSSGEKASPIVFYV